MNNDSNDPQKRPLIDNTGFTLLEVIAVLVILSILAVVAVPKYFELQEQARLKALGSGVAEAVGRVNGYFAQQVLNDIAPSLINYQSTELGTDLGDFYVEVSGSGAPANGTGDITLTVYGRNNTPVQTLSTVRIVPRPGL